MDVSIVIRTYNEAQYLGEVLTMIMNQKTEKRLEIIVVDSESSDNTLEIIARFPTVELIRIRKSEFTFGRALNLGFAAATGTFGVSISGHCIPISESWLEKLLQPMEDARVGLVTGRQIGNQATRFAESRIFDEVFPTVSVDVYAEPFANNANCAFRMHLWQSLKFDEALTGLEDLEFAKRCQRLGFSSSYSADATVVHCHLENNAKVFNRFLREEIALRRIYPDKKKGSYALFNQFLSRLISDIVEAKKASRLAAGWRGILGYRIAQFYAMYLVNQGPVYQDSSYTGLHRCFLRLFSRGSDSLESIWLRYLKTENFKERI